MTPKKSVIDALMGDQAAALDIYMGVMASYLLTSLANDYLTDATDKLRAKGMVMGETKQMFGQLQRQFDRYHKHLFAMLPGNRLSRAFMEDYDELRSIVDGYILGHNAVKEEGDKEV